MINPFSFLSRNDNVAEQLRASGETAHQLYGELSISYHRLFTDRKGDIYEWVGLDKRVEEVKRFELTAERFLEKIYEEQEKNRQIFSRTIWLGFILLLLYLFKSEFFNGLVNFSQNNISNSATQRLNQIGLVLNTIGGLLIFFFGIPPKVDREGNQYLLLEGEDKQEKIKAKKYDFISNTGLVLLITGFIFQLISSF